MSILKLKGLKAALIVFTLLVITWIPSISSAHVLLSREEGKYVLTRENIYLSFFLNKIESLNFAEAKTGYNNSCGPTAMLFAHSFKRYIETSSVPSYSEDTEGVLRALDLAYDYLARKYPGYGYYRNSYTKADHLTQYGKEQLEFGSSGVIYIPGYDFDEGFKKDFAAGRIFVVNLKAFSTVNPLSVKHFVTLLSLKEKSGQYFVKYFDPWDGVIKETSLDNLKSSVDPAMNIIRLNPGGFGFLKGGVKLYLFL